MTKSLDGKTLYFTQRLFDMGQNLQRLGQAHAAARLLGRLSSFRELPKDLAEETHLRLAELHLDSKQFKKARRQLTAVLAVQPDNARAHYLMAEAALEDDFHNPRRALLHYRQCTKLDADNPTYWCALGLLSLDVGETARGLAALRRAAKLAPDEPGVLRQVVAGLRAQGELDEAKRILRTAFFRNPRDERFRALWSQHQFQLLHMTQRENEQPSELPEKKGVVLLPFIRPARPANLQAAKQIRRDLPSGTPGPKMPLRRLPRKKKA